jgi:hypothetical protein
VPARKTAVFAAPAEGGDVVVKFVEGVTEIRKTIPEKKEKAPREDEEEEESEEEEEEEEEIKTKHMKIDTLLAEALLKGVEKGQKIEVTVQAAADTSLNIAARIVGTQQGVRGVIKAPVA